jgi:hypothetical protein
VVRLLCTRYFYIKDYITWLVGLRPKKVSS